MIAQFSAGRSFSVRRFSSIVDVVRCVHRVRGGRPHNAFYTQHSHLKPSVYQERSQKFILGGYNFLLYDTTVPYTNNLTTLAAISAQNNFQ